MTEHRDEPPRVDLGALAPTDAQAERVIGGVMARLTTRPQIERANDDALATVGGFLSPTWIAAAAVLAIAGSAAIVASSRSAPEAESLDTTVATWAMEQHVPTNAELLLTFQGYQR